MRIDSDLPGKIFIAGEYGVLASGRALVASTRPRFQLVLGRHTGTRLMGLAAASPVGRLIQSFSPEEKELASQYQFLDPLQGAGGFGASTAQFALLLNRVRPSMNAQAAWMLYHDLHEKDDVPPSGADLYAQWQGGLQLWTGSGTGRGLLLNSDRDFEIAIVGAGHQSGRKVATHHHLPKLKEIAAGRALWVSELEGFVENVTHEITGVDGGALGLTLSSLGQFLGKQALEIEATRHDIEALEKVPGVFGVKGAGAMQADALVAVVAREHPESFLKTCAERNLHFLGWIKYSGKICLILRF
jgi:hypothetical protein